MLKEREISEKLYKRSSIKTFDLWRFAIPCLLENFHFNNALWDLGASCNMMSYSIFKKLGFGELEPTRYYCLQFANGSLGARGIAKDMIVRFEKFRFLENFIVINMNEEKKMT